MHLTPFERYMWLDDRPEYPMAFRQCLQFAGKLNESLIQQAIEVALARHPLLTAALDAAKNQLYWRLSPALRPHVSIEPAGVPCRYPRGERIDLAEEPGVRLWVRSGPATSELVVQVHHAVCDGIGLARFVEDILLAYAALCDGRDVESLFRPLDKNLLARRGTYGMRPWSMLARSPIEMFNVATSAVFFWNRPHPLGGVSVYGAESPAANPCVPTLPGHLFSREETATLVELARARRVTVNDLLLRDAMWSVGRWNRQFDPRGGIVRMSVPVNLRWRGGEAMPACNVVGMVFLDRRPHRYKHPDQLLASLHRDMKVVKLLNIGTAMSRVVRLLEATIGTRVLVDAPHCQTTAVLSNMGRVFDHLPLPRSDGKLHVGDALLESFTSAPPCRPLTHGAFMVHTYGGQLGLTLNYNRGVFAEGVAEALLQNFVAEIRQTLASHREELARERERKAA